MQVFRDPYAKSFEMNVARQTVTLAAFLSLAINGLTFTFLGASLPLVQAYLGISIDRATLLIASLQAGFTISSLVSGILSDSCRRERILMVGCLLLGSGSMAFGTFSSFLLNAAAACVMGSGMGCILSGSNILLITLYPLKKGAILNIHHIFFGLGSLLGPLLLTALLALSLGWRTGFIGEFLILFLLALFFSLTKGKVPRRSNNVRLSSQLKELSGDTKFRIILLVNILAVGTQITLMVLGISYLIAAKESSLTAAGVTISLFSVAMMVGRLVCSRLTTRFRHTGIIAVLLWLQFAALLLVWLSTPWLSLVAVVLSGLAFSGIYPTSLALSGIFFPGVAGSALGILSTMGGLGSIVLCWLTGLVAGLTNMQTGFIVILLASFLGASLFQINFGFLCKGEDVVK